MSLLVKPERVIKALERNGFHFVNQRGSHRKYKNNDGKIVIVPMHYELAKGTLSSILEQSGLSIDDLKFKS